MEKVVSINTQHKRCVSCLQTGISARGQATIDLVTNTTDAGVV